MHGRKIYRVKANRLQLALPKHEEERWPEERPKRSRYVEPNYG